MRKMDRYDVLIVGAGPAGGQCARELAASGKKVLLIEKAKSFQENNYSSGGAPLEMMEEFSLPKEIVGSYWNQLVMKSANEKTVWQSPSPLGTILDFDKLRQFLSEEAIKDGGDFQLDCRYISHSIYTEGVHVKLKYHDEESIVTAKVLVDATGSERKVLSKETPSQDKGMDVTGIEFHINVKSEIYQKFDKSLTFYLGPKWMPQGYGWIFPMASNKLKVGVIRYFKKQHYVPSDPSYRHYLDQLIALCGQIDESEIADKHGKTISYTFGQKDICYDGPVIALGDAISSINPLGCEGIRHALVSGRIAAREINSFLDNTTSSFENYRVSIKKYFGKKWFFSEILMNHLYKAREDRIMDHIVKSFQLMTPEEGIDVVFNYRFRWVIKPFLVYAFKRLKDRVK